jgi:diguanylate cyclase (GGDEF)-like protein
VRETDYAIRWGGEEFLVVLPGLRRGEAAATLQRLHAGLRDRPFLIDGQARQSITCSIGYAELPADTNDVSLNADWEPVVELADRALYLVKRSGRDGWALLKAGEQLDSGTLLEALREDLQGCIDRGQVSIELHRHEPNP